MWDWEYDTLSMTGTELRGKVANDAAEKAYNNWRMKDLLGHDR